MARIPGRQPSQRLDITRALQKDGRAVVGWEHEIKKGQASQNTWQELVLQIETAAKSHPNSLIILSHDLYWQGTEQQAKLTKVFKCLKSKGYPFASLVVKGNKVYCGAIGYGPY